MFTRLSAALLLASSSIAATAQPIAGTWQGEATSEKWPTFLRLDIAPDDRGKATLMVLGQTVDLGPITNDDTLDATVDGLRVRATAKGDRLVGTLSEAGKTFRFNLQKVAVYPPTSDRLVGWSRDLDAVRDQVLAFDRSYDRSEKAQARGAIEQLRADLPRLNDDQVLVRLSRIAAMANNGHTRLYFLRNRTEVRRMPIRVWWFGKELRVVRAAPDYAAYLAAVSIASAASRP